MALRLQPAGRIDRQPAVLLRDALGNRARALPFRHQPHRLVFDQFGDGEAVMRLDEGQIVERDAGLRQRLFPGQRAALEFENVALRHRQEILHMLRGAEHDRLVEPQRGLDIGQHQRRRAVRHQRAIGALERTRRRTDSCRFRCGRSRSRDPCAIARTDCRHRSCGSWPRSSRARRTGRRISGNRARRSCRRCRRSRPRYRPRRAHRTPSAGSCRSRARASSSSVRRRRPARCAPVRAAMLFSP